MIERKNGLMLVMSSASGMSPQPALPVYGSTKSYVLQLSRSLQVYLDKFFNSISSESIPIRVFRNLFPCLSTTICPNANDRRTFEHCIKTYLPQCGAVGPPGTQVRHGQQRWSLSWLPVTRVPYLVSGQSK